MTQIDDSEVTEHTAGDEKSIDQPGVCGELYKGSTGEELSDRHLDMEDTEQPFNHVDVTL